MRIIAGKYKGRLIRFPKHIRPTQDKIRQSIFDVLAPVVKGARVLDLFAGSGAFGLEALSRDAKEVVFVDNDPRSCRVVIENLKALGFGRWQGLGIGCFRQEAFRAVRILEKKGRAFDIVFLDPPYNLDLAKKALKTLGDSGILTTRSFVIAEHSRTEILPNQAGCLSLLKHLQHGSTIVSIYQYNAE
ncbi:MAG: 16S rRNA (guanine(966)-N(2))-methyltransferase RsmD [Candidatus Omnitrophota bacterium]